MYSKSYLYLLIAICFLAISCTQEEKKADNPHKDEKGIVAYKTDKGWGYRRDGKPLLDDKYEHAEPFSPEGFAYIMDDRGWGFINSEGVVLVRPMLVGDGPDKFSEGVSRYAMNGKIGYFNDKGILITKPKFSYASAFQDSIGIVCIGCRADQIDAPNPKVTGGKWGGLNTDGKLVIPIEYEFIESFTNGKAKGVINGKSILINRKGETLEQ